MRAFSLDKNPDKAPKLLCSLKEMLQKDLIAMKAEMVFVCEETEELCELIHLTQKTNEPVVIVLAQR